MRKYIPLLLFVFPLIILILILVYIESVKGENTFESYQNSAILLGVVCITAASVGYFLDMVYKGALKSLMKTDPTKEEKKIFPRIFAYFTLGLLFSFFFLWTKVDNEAATKKCFQMYDDEASIRHCIESGENVPDYGHVNF